MNLNFNAGPDTGGALSNQPFRYADSVENPNGIKQRTIDEILAILDRLSSGMTLERTQINVILSDIGNEKRTDYNEAVKQATALACIEPITED